MKIGNFIALLLALTLCLGISSMGMAKVEADITDPIFHDLAAALLGDTAAGLGDNDTVLSHVKSAVGSMYHTGIFTREQANAVYSVMTKLKGADYADYDATYKALCKLANTLEPTDVDFENNTVNVTAYIMDRLDAARLESGRYACALADGKIPAVTNLQDVLHNPIAMAPGPVMGGSNIPAADQLIGAASGAAQKAIEAAKNVLEKLETGADEETKKVITQAKSDLQAAMDTAKTDTAKGLAEASDALKKAEGNLSGEAKAAVSTAKQALDAAASLAVKDAEGVKGEVTEAAKKAQSVIGGLLSGMNK